MTISVSITTGNREMCVCFWKESSATGAGSSVVVKQVSFLLSWENLKQRVLPFSEKEERLQFHHIRHVLYRSLSLYGRDGLAEYLVYSPRFIYVFQQLKTSFLLCLIEGAVSSPSSACGLG